MTDGGKEILPRVLVSVGNGDSYAKIIDGHLRLVDENPMRLSNVLVLKSGVVTNATQDGDPNMEVEPVTQVGKQNMEIEPGRVVYHSLYVNSKAHKSSVIKAPPVAVISKLHYVNCMHTAQCR